jgi:hypothetical protein
LGFDYIKPFFDGSPAATSPATGDPVAAPEATAPVSVAVQKFKTCRWRRPAEDGLPVCCSHRDVLPIAGAHSFDPEAWCPECTFYKLRRTPKKRSPEDYRY